MVFLFGVAGEDKKDEEDGEDKEGREEIAINN